MRLKYFRNADGSLNLNAPDGGVHDLFSVTGRSDAGSCQIGQPNFAQELASNNAVFRIPTPTFGDGLIEGIDDTTILANQAAEAAIKAKLGICRLIPTAAGMTAPSHALAGRRRTNRC